MALTKVGLKVQRIQGSIRPIVLFKKMLLKCTRSINKTNVPFNLQLQIRLLNLRYLGHKIAGSSRIQLAMDTDCKWWFFYKPLVHPGIFLSWRMGHPPIWILISTSFGKPTGYKTLLRIARVGLCTTAQSKGKVVHIQFNTNERKKENMSSHFRGDARNSGNRMQGTFPYYNLDYITLNHKRKCLSKGYLNMYNVF